MNNSDTSHYENVPNNWAITSFEEIVELISGRDLETSSCNDIKEGIPYLIGASNIVKRSLFITRWTTKPIVISQKNDILISCKGTIGEVIRNTIGDIHIARQFMALRNNSIVDTNYIELYIRAILERIKSDARGVIPGISREDILCREILLPPLNEQKRIVLEANKLISIIEKINVDKNELVKAIAAYKLTILQLAITGKLVPQDLSDEPAIDLLKRVNPNYKPCDNRHYENIELSIPEPWCWATVGDVFKHNTGKALNSSNHSGIMMDYITTSNLYWDRFDLSTVKQMPFTEKDLEKCTVTKGDLLICEGGDVGRSAIWNYNYDIQIQNHIHRLRGKGNICVRYFFYVLMLYKQKNYIGGKGVAIQGLSSRGLHNLPIPIPPLKEQYRIVETLDNLIAKMNKITAEL